MPWSSGNTWLLTRRDGLWGFQLAQDVIEEVCGKEFDNYQDTVSSAMMCLLLIASPLLLDNLQNSQTSKKENL